MLSSPKQGWRIVPCGRPRVINNLPSYKPRVPGETLLSLASRCGSKQRLYPGIFTGGPRGFPVYGVGGPASPTLVFRPFLPCGDPLPEGESRCRLYGEKIETRPERTKGAGRPKKAEARLCLATRTRHGTGPSPTPASCAQSTKPLTPPLPLGPRAGRLQRTSSLRLTAGRTAGDTG